MTTETVGEAWSAADISRFPARRPRTLLGIGGNVREHHVGILVLDPSQGLGAGAGGRGFPVTRSRARVRRTRHPSRKVCRFDCPEMRDSSWLGHLGNAQAGPRGPHNQFGFDFEAVRLQLQDLHAFPAEGDVAVAKVGVVAVEDGVGQPRSASGCRCCAAR